jgi:carboxymethylenebutenolidase
MCNPATNYWPGKQKRPGTDVEVTSKDGTRFQVHIARPEGDPPYPTVLVIPDYFDPEHYYYDLAEQYAAAGYLGVSPDPFVRQGKLREQSHADASARIASVADEDVLADIDATLDYLRQENLLGSVAVTGFCWGGRMAYLVGARHPEVKLVLPFYGPVTAGSGPDGNKPYSPLDEAGKSQARVLGFYGGGDPSIPLDQVADMERRLRDAGVRAELHVVDGAPHCFFRTPEWQSASDDAWNQVLAGLRESVA